MRGFLPVHYQPALPLDRLLLRGAPSPEAIPLDVLIVGAGPAGLATAIELASLVQRDNEGGGGLGEVSIGVLEKAASLGEHNLSGAVVNPRAFRELFPGMPDTEFPFRQPVAHEAVYLLGERRAWRLPTPPTMRNVGNYSASICEIVRWLGAQAEALGVDLFTGYPADALYLENDRVAGVRTTASGLDRDGSRTADFTEPTDLTAKITVLAEGSRGSLTQGWRAAAGVDAPNPQIYALGVKEVWKVARPLNRIIHTLGWPLPRDTFGGTWLYPMGEDQVSLGLVAGLDAPNAGLDVHELVQRLKLHPLVRPLLEGGELIEWGAKTIPEGGFHALPERCSGDGILLVGDAAGFVDVPSLKGIHYAIQSGIFAGRAAFAALKSGDCSAVGLASYDRMVASSYITSDLYRTRNMRLAFRSGFLRGGLKAGLMTITGGRFPARRIAMEADAQAARTRRHLTPVPPDGVLTFSKLDAVFKSGNATRDTIPSHLVANNVPEEVVDFYVSLCPAGVYEKGEDGSLRINPPNCVDCKATDVVGPRWTPREGGSGPRYRMM